MADNQTTPQGVAELSDADLFQQAMAPDPAPASQPGEQQPPAPATPPEPVTPGNQPRDPATGQWVSRDQTAPQAPAAATQQQQPIQTPPGQQAPPTGQQDDGNVPSWRHRELREQRDAFELRNRQLENAYIDQQRRLRELEGRFQQAQQPPQPLPDMITDPNGYHAYVQQQFGQQLRNMEANFSFRLAHQQHGELFEQAYGEMIQRAERGDPTVAQAVMNSPDPGAAMVNWFHRERTLAQVGADPAKWSDDRHAERLKTDAKYRGELLAQIRQLEAQAQQPNGQGGPVQLPPSLNRMAASAPVVPGQ